LDRHKFIKFWKENVEGAEIVEVITNHKGVSGFRLSNGIIIRYDQESYGLNIEREQDGSPVIYN